MNCQINAFDYCIVLFLLALMSFPSLSQLTQGNLTKVSASAAEQFGAKCLDGTPPAYYVWSGNESKKFVIFLEGGGWCFTDVECVSRSRGGLGSSKGYAHQMADAGGIMSMNSTENPYFANFTKVFVKYCDGSSFTGNRVSTSNVNGEEIWYRGRPNLDAVLEQLSSDHNVNEAVELVLSGGSAGGLAVYLNLDHVAAKLPSTHVVGFPDAGYFADLPNTKGSFVYRSYFQTADPIWNSTASGGTNARCLRKYSGTSDVWKCLMAQYVAEFMVTPFFVINAAIDVYQVQHILEVGCVTSKCSLAQLAQIDQYRIAFLDTLASVQKGHNNGAWIDSCFMHEQNVYYCSGRNIHALNCQGWQHEKVKGTTPQEAFFNYYASGSSVHSAFIIENISWPHNPTCNWNFTMMTD